MPNSNVAHTMFEKIWSSHKIIERADGQILLHVDRHFIQDGHARAYDLLRERGLKLRMPHRTFGTPDHYLSTAKSGINGVEDPERRRMVQTLVQFATDEGATLFGPDDRRQGIVHVVGPEQGLTQPGMVIVCGDSHTGTHGAMGTLAYGIGSSEVAHVLATQTLWQRKPRSMRIAVENRLSESVTAKDVILAIIAKIGIAGAVGHVIEYAGTVISGLSMEGRLTVCNMSIEAGARAGMIAPDDTTYDYLERRPYAPKGKDWDAALAHWRALPSDADAQFDREIVLDGASIAPMVTWGTTPQDVSPVTGVVPDPASIDDLERRKSVGNALAYMGLTPGARLDGIAVDRVFIGSCTNGRIEDMRAAAGVLRGRKVAPGVKAWAVPGSGLVKAQAEAEGLDRVFASAGVEWRLAGCSMCVGTNGDIIAPGQRCASTSNRNFVGRQGPGARTHLMSPAMAAAAAVTGHITDVRTLRVGA
jgi:3-isopropylmalate/(R)-2-methylmalate dehydratase large subunit